MVMINLAMKEDEYGVEVTTNGPKKREYVGGHMFVYFFIESLLFLCIALGVAVLLFMKNGFSIPTDEIIIIAALLIVSFILTTYIGETIVKHTATKRYKSLSAARKEYRRDLAKLEKLIENEF